MLSGNSYRPVARTARAPDSKSGGWGFESLLACRQTFGVAIEMISKATKFLSEVKVEVKKVTWPARKEAIGGTTVVVIVVFLVALFLGVVDALLSELVQALIAL